MHIVQDQINEKNVALIIKGGKLTAKMLAKAMKAFLDGSKKVGKELTTPKNMAGKGKQTVKQLTRQGVGVSNIEISDKNIKAFEGVARKYGVDFALKKDVSEVPSKWMVFFKGRDAEGLYCERRLRTPSYYTDSQPIRSRLARHFTGGDIWLKRHLLPIFIETIKRKRRHPRKRIIVDSSTTPEGGARQV